MFLGRCANRRDSKIYARILVEEKENTRAMFCDEKSAKYNRLPRAKRPQRPVLQSCFVKD
jgi:hypothetical protein